MNFGDGGVVVAGGRCWNLELVHIAKHFENITGLSCDWATRRASQSLTVMGTLGREKDALLALEMLIVSSFVSEQISINQGS